MKKDKQRNLTIVLSIVYLLILIWILLFKMSFSLEELYRSRSINLIPFAQSTIVNGRIHISEIINNVIVFVPVGIYASMLIKDESIIKQVSLAFWVSLSIEVLQFILAVGASDITDLIGNTMGGVIGIGVFYLFTMVFKSRTVKVFNILTSIATVGLCSFLTIILLIN